MKKTKRIVVLVMVMVLAISALTGCSVKEESTINNAIKTVNEAKSFQAKVTANIEMPTGFFDDEQATKLTYTMDISTIVESMKTKAMLNLSTSGAAMDMEVYMAKEDDAYMTYMKASEIFDGWSKQKVCDADQIEEIKENSTMGMGTDTFMKEDYNYEKQDDVEENGKSYVVYTAKMTKEGIKKIVEGMGFLSAAGIDQSQIEETIEALGSIPFTIWIDKDSETLYRMKMDLGSILEKTLSSILDEDSKKDGSIKFDIDIVYTAYNEVGDFEVPAEALEAKK